MTFDIAYTIGHNLEVCECVYCSLLRADAYDVPELRDVPVDTEGQVCPCRECTELKIRMEVADEYEEELDRRLKAL